MWVLKARVLCKNTLFEFLMNVSFNLRIKIKKVTLVSTLIQ